MKIFLTLMLAFAILISYSGLTIASEKTKISRSSNADDIKWIAKCMDDNKNEGQTVEVVRKYCECMVSKMDENETRSVTQWEKSHPKERKECDKVSGWK